jgi:hypothetical protein
MCPVKDDQSVVIDREPDQEKGPDASGAPSVVGRLVSMMSGLAIVATCGTRSIPRRLPIMPSSVDDDPMPLVPRMVAAF